MKDSKVQAILEQYGWVNLDDFQSFYGLKADGIVGPLTSHMLRAPRICGNEDVSAAGGCQWPFKDVTYNTHAWRISQFSNEVVDEIYDEAMDSWNAVCGLTLHRIDERRGNIYTTDSPQGRGGTLATSYLPCGNPGRSTRMKQWYDSAENWSRQFLLAVMVHEIGHAIGLDHSGSRSDIMYPYANNSIYKPATGDIRRVVSRYGDPIPDVPDVPDVPDIPDVPDVPPVDPPPTGSHTGILFLPDGPRHFAITIGEKVG